MRTLTETHSRTEFGPAIMSMFTSSPGNHVATDVTVAIAHDGGQAKCLDWFAELGTLERAA